MTSADMKVAVVGSGVAGLAAAWTLARAGIDVDIYEKDSHVGGHAWTVLAAPDLPVDVGFMVLNRVTYPNLISFFDEIGVDLETSDMSFSVSLDKGRGCEWGSNGLQGLFAQKRNALNPSFLYMIREMLKFQTDVTQYLARVESDEKASERRETLEQFLVTHKYSTKFQDCYLLPVCASIWSCSTEGVLGFSAFSVLSFLRNHHMLQILGRPQWLTVKGRSETYVKKVVSELESRGCNVFTDRGVTEILTTDSGVEIKDSSGNSVTYEKCIVATHAPDVIPLLGKQASTDERQILGAFLYASSDIYLHRDSSFMPRRKAAWSAWNFQGSGNGDLSVTYWLNVLQNLGDTGAPVFVTLNPSHEPRDVVQKWKTGHPIPSPAAAMAASQLATIQGKRNLWFCGAYQGYGFHEDGFKAGMVAAKNLLGEAFVPLSNHKFLVPSWSQYAARAAVLAFLKGFIHLGILRVCETGGTAIEFGGEGVSSEKKASMEACLHVKNPAFYWKVATRADLGLADAFVDGDFTCKGGSDGLLAFLLMLIANRDRARRPSMTPLRTKGWWRPAMPTAILGSAALYWRHLSRSNTLTKARRNISDHYDLSNDMFATFLDKTMTYSCAIFKEPHEDLEPAQLRKLQHMIKKARIESHHHVLEIGFGWGSMAMEVVKSTGCRYTGITLSKQQLELAEQRVKAAGLQDRISFKLCDYRQLPGVGVYDRILSCEMLEAVGHEFIGEYFANCDRLLKLEGLLVVQVITTPEERYEEYRRSSDFIKEYIFPGCCVPAFGALVSAMASSSLFSVEHMENIGPHYTTTLLRWRDNFLKRKEDIMRMGFSDQFIRMWDYYFVYCAAGFKTCTLGDLQIVFSRSGNMATIGDPYTSFPSS